MLKNKKIYIILAVIVIIFFIAIIISRSTKVDVEISGIDFIIGVEEYKSVNVKITGEINRHLFKEDEIMFDLYLNGDQVLKSKEDVVSDTEIIINENHINSLLYNEKVSEKSFKSCIISSKYIEDKTLKRSLYGHLYFSDDFEDIIIAVADENGMWSSNSGNRIIISEPDIENSSELLWEMLGIKLD